MNKVDALKLSLDIDEICIESKVEVTPEDSLQDVTIKMVKKQNPETLSELYEKFQGRTSNLANKLIMAIEEEWRIRAIE